MSKRVLVPEVMDDPNLDRQRHRRALRGLARLNWISRSGAVLWPYLATLARRNNGRPLRVLDVATGSGDIPVYLGQVARRRGIPLELHACDTSKRALATARHRAHRKGIQLHLFQQDVIQQPLAEPYDVVISSLFLHHLAEDEARGLLRDLGAATTQLLLVHDLRRASVGLLAAQLMTRVVSRSDVVHVDGPRSVRAAFTISEVEQLAAQAGLQDVRIRARWPWRFLLEYRPSC